MISHFFERFGLGPMWRPHAGQKSASARTGSKQCGHWWSAGGSSTAVGASERAWRSLSANVCGTSIPGWKRRMRTFSGCSQSIHSVIASGWMSMSVTPPGSRLRGITWVRARPAGPQASTARSWVMTAQPGSHCAPVQTSSGVKSSPWSARPRKALRSFP